MSYNANLFAEQLEHTRVHSFGHKDIYKVNTSMKYGGILGYDFYTWCGPLA
jgi:hypothetical protein